MPLFLDLDTAVSPREYSRRYPRISCWVRPRDGLSFFFFGMGGEEICVLPLSGIEPPGRSSCSLVAIDSWFRC